MATQGSINGNMSQQSEKRISMKGKKPDRKMATRKSVGTSSHPKGKKHKHSPPVIASPATSFSQRSNKDNGELVESSPALTGVPNTLLLNTHSSRHSDKGNDRTTWEDDHTHTTSSTSVSGSFVTASDAWIQCDKNGKTANERQADLQQFARTTLFKNLKMITNEQMMFYQSEPKSFCQETCKAMHAKPEFKQHWWNSNAKVIAKAINGRRSDVTQAMKKAFMGESMDFQGTSCFQLLWWSVMISPSLQMDQRFVTMMAGKCC